MLEVGYYPPHPLPDRNGDVYRLPLSLRERAKGEGISPSSPSLLPQGEKGASRGALARALKYYRTSPPPRGRGMRRCPLPIGCGSSTATVRRAAPGNLTATARPRS